MCVRARAFMDEIARRRGGCGTKLAEAAAHGEAVEGEGGEVVDALLPQAPLDPAMHHRVHCLHLDHRHASSPA